MRGWDYMRTIHPHYNPSCHFMLAFPVWPSPCCACGVRYSSLLSHMCGLYRGTTTIVAALIGYGNARWLLG